ncbi:hypothetical protein DQ384_05110 [Sphaerisporangium album]|uniref:Uncharacterized protein n=1 Tax=Sphaerisporangium album TaxID=509200 RepID=A0A367FQN8_9ACTN|nr:hypothetical protein [Sphaerisporangium album]RCG31925.1 hypothetical protein DQ384_05110 [Sphaerisporangium album]
MAERLPPIARPAILLLGGNAVIVHGILAHFAIRTDHPIMAAYCIIAGAGLGLTAAAALRSRPRASSPEQPTGSLPDDLDVLAESIIRTAERNALALREPAADLAYAYHRLGSAQRHRLRADHPDLHSAMAQIATHFEPRGRKGNTQR